MPGVNYMGGKRNAAKTRSRDKIGRVQKDFFYRRRLNILSKGLSAPLRLTGNSDKATFASQNTVARVSIDLGHARRSISAGTCGEGNLDPPAPPTRSVFRTRERDSDVNTEDSRSSPGSRRITDTAVSSAPKRVKSRLFEQLDLLEPISSSTVIGRILAMPDLAGLSFFNTNARPSPSVGQLGLVKLEGSETTRDAKERIMDGECCSPYNESSLEAYQLCSTPRSFYTLPQADDTFSSVGSSRMKLHIADRLHTRPNQIRGSFSSELMVASDPRSSRVATDSDESIDWPSLRASRLTRVEMSGTRQGTGSSSPSLDDWSFSSPSLSSRLPSPQTSEGRASKDGEHSIFGCTTSSPQKIKGVELDSTRWEYPKNLLEFSDPWAQIGSILGLRDDKCCGTVDQGSLCNYHQDEGHVSENRALVESDLPPSDIPSEGSFDTTQYIRSSLPYAGSSDTAVVSSDLANNHKTAHKLGIWDEEGIEPNSNGDDHGQNMWDAADEHSLFGILPLTGTQDGGITRHETTTSIIGVAAGMYGRAEYNSPSPFQTEVCQRSPLNELSPGGDGGLRAASLSEPLLIPEKCRSKELTMTHSSVYDGPEGEDVDGLVSEERTDDLSSHGADVANGGECHHTSSGVRAGADCHTVGVLTIPELLECNGVYQGPCLLSESDCSEVEA